MATITLGKIKFIHRGNYNETQTYTKGDIVKFNERLFIYKNDAPKQYTPILLPTLRGTVSSLGITTSVITVTFSGYNPSTKPNYICTSTVPNLGYDLATYPPRIGHRVFSKYFSGNTGISSVGNVTSTTAVLYLTQVGINSSTITNDPIIIGPRRIATGYDIQFNDEDWDLWSDGYVYRGDYNERTTYFPGDIISKRNSSYMCGYAHSGSDPMFDHLGAWEMFSRGDDLMPSDRILGFVNNQPFGWTGHPFILGPQWGTNNRWNGNIPWNTSLGIGSTSPHAWRWNPGTSKGHMCYRSLEMFINGDGVMMTEGGTPNSFYSHNNLTHIDTQEIDIPYNIDWLKNQEPNLNNLSWEKSLVAPRVIQAVHAWSSLRAYVLSNGTVSVAGDGGYGYWGAGNDDGTSTNACYSIPKSVFKNRQIVKLASGGNISRDADTHLIALDEYGEIHLWARNDTGQCGISSEPHNPMVFYSANGTLDDSRCWNVHTMNKDQFFGGARVVDIWAGHRTSYALTEDGQLWSWGYNLYGQLGYPTNTGYRSTDRNRSPKPLPINWNTYGGIQKFIVAASENSDFIVLLDGQGYVWTQGRNNVGQLGDGTTTSGNNTSTLTRRTAWTGAAQIVNVWADTDNDSTAHIWYRLQNGNVYGVGYNGHRNLTDNTTTNQTLPVAINGPDGNLRNIVTMTSGGRSGGVTQMFLDDKGYVYATGWNNHGEGGTGQAGVIANNLVRYQNTTQLNYALARTMHSPFHQANPGLGVSFSGALCVDVHVNGDFDSASSHTPESFSMFDNGEVFARGRNYDWGWGTRRGDCRGSVPMHNFGG
jgi:alpha-tubulin suppressor-like RCC1 family protein